MELHLKLHRLVAEYYDGSKTPFFVVASCTMLRVETYREILAKAREVVK